MTSTHPIANLQKQRAGIRRTVWIVGGIAFAMFVLFVVKQSIWH